MLLLEKPTLRAEKGSPPLEKMQACCSNTDLSSLIASYLLAYDLLSLEEVSPHWQAVVSRQFQELHRLEPYQHLTYKQHPGYCNLKQACCFVEKKRDEGVSSLVIIGGSFGCPTTTASLLTLSKEIIRPRPMVAFQNDAGTQAVAMDGKGVVYSFGGFNADDITLDSVLSWSMADKALEEQEQNHHPVCLPRPTCFAAATSTVGGDIVLTGGCSNPFQGAEVFTACHFFNTTTKNWENDKIFPMLHARCGHEVVTLMDGRLFAVGGYRGAVQEQQVYQTSAEIWDWQQQTWTLTNPMKFPRSGFACGIGPGGAVYVAGGSIDGTIGTKTMERFDPREGTWQTLPPMQLPRGYTTGCVTYTGQFCVSGGLHESRIQAGMEAYDFAAGKWMTIISNQHHTAAMFPNIADWADYPTDPLPIPRKNPLLTDLQCLRSCHRMILAP